MEFVIKGRLDPTIVDWIVTLVSRHTVTPELRLTIDVRPARADRRRLWGSCYYPRLLKNKSKRSPYRIVCHAPGPWPIYLAIRNRPKAGREWIPVYGRVRLNNCEEGVAFLVLHELFHFLSRSGAIPQCNNELQADSFAILHFRRFQKWRRTK